MSNILINSIEDHFNLARFIQSKYIINMSKDELIKLVEELRIMAWENYNNNRLNARDEGVMV